MIRRLTLLLLLLTFASLVAAGCGQYGKRYGADNENTNSSSGEKKISEQKFNDAVRERDGCTKVEELDSEGHAHTNKEVSYKNNPPTSGDHQKSSDIDGLYDEEQPDSAIVHSLALGHIVITHKGLSDKKLNKLLDHARINPSKLVLMPREKNPKNGVFYTAWNAQVFCKKPSAPALQYMIDTWSDKGPEVQTDTTTTDKKTGDS